MQTLLTTILCILKKLVITIENESVVLHDAFDNPIE